MSRASHLVTDGELSGNVNGPQQFPWVEPNTSYRGLHSDFHSCDYFTDDTEEFVSSTPAYSQNRHDGGHDGHHTILDAERVQPSPQHGTQATF